MWAFGVKFIDEIIKAGLLGQAVLASRARGLALQSEVHALVTAILLRLTRLDAFFGKMAGMEIEDAQLIHKVRAKWFASH